MSPFVTVACALLVASAILVVFQTFYGTSKVGERINNGLLAASSFLFASHFFCIADNGLAGVGFLMAGLMLLTGIFSSEQDV